MKTDALVSFSNFLENDLLSLGDNVDGEFE